MQQQEKLPRLKTDAEASEYLGVTTGTLAVWRSTNRYGLPFVKIGALVRYQENDLSEFVARRRRSVSPRTKK
jgi:excisionase family DNA binding protein